MKCYVQRKKIIRSICKEIIVYPGIIVVIIHLKNSSSIRPDFVKKEVKLKKLLKNLICV